MTKIQIDFFAITVLGYADLHLTIGDVYACRIGIDYLQLQASLVFSFSALRAIAFDYKTASPMLLKYVLFYKVSNNQLLLYEPTEPN